MNILAIVFLILKKLEQIPNTSFFSISNTNREIEAFFYLKGSTNFKSDFKKACHSISMMK